MVFGVEQVVQWVFDVGRWEAGAGWMLMLMWGAVAEWVWDGRLPEMGAGWRLEGLSEAERVWGG